MPSPGGAGAAAGRHGALRDANDRLRERLRARRSRSDGWLVYQALSVPVDRLLAALDDLLTDSAPAKVSA